MQFSYVLIDGSQVIEPTLELIKAHDAFLCVAVCANRTEGINKILELKPDVVFMHLDRLSTPDEDAIRLSLLSELHEFLDVMPTIIVLSSSKEQAQDIVYLKADNNTTDFYLQSGKVITAFKTLKHFEQLLPFYFFRIHHSYVINVGHVSRINLGKNQCYLLNNEIALPFSRTYKEAIDTIIIRIS